MSSTNQPFTKQTVSKSHNAGLLQVDLLLMFDTNESNLFLLPGEQIIDILQDIEDTKGNNGMLGRLVVTNLRLLWLSATNNSVNLSMGLNCIAYLTVKIAQSKLRGSTQSLSIGCILKDNRYEFLFTNTNPDENSRVFQTVNSVLKAYRSSRLYREVQLRGNLMHDKKLELLPNEMLEEVVSGVWHLAGEQGTLGVVHLTNFRVVWCSAMDDNVNISLPFLQLQSVSFKETKYGRAIVLETSLSSGHYLLGFRVDPQERVQELFELLASGVVASDKRPYHGIEIAVEEQRSTQNSGGVASATTMDAQGRQRFITAWQQRDDINIVDERSTYLQSVAPVNSQPQQQQQQKDIKSIYQTQPAPSAQISADSVMVYDPHLGLAVERITDPSIQSIEQLWSVLTT